MEVGEIRVNLIDLFLNHVKEGMVLYRYDFRQQLTTYRVLECDKNMKRRRINSVVLQDIETQKIREYRHKSTVLMSDDPYFMYGVNKSEAYEYTLARKPIKEYQSDDVRLHLEKLIMDNYTNWDDFWESSNTSRAITRKLIHSDGEIDLKFTTMLSISKALDVRIQDWLPIEDDLLR